ncbi:hypothetical protein LPJ66_004607 [Kickxella alabastrina]|uniref:Uncharacterized protein n=1 Tax=Kickxella alabastrina TaxID=61397 RepID=A0ACC1IL76_9FUNG|nr:hypothetical protein LPJ66_004607 [Kickxella alabastrina]
MGVKQLTSLLARFAPSSITAPTATAIRGWTLGIDSNIFVHRFFRGTERSHDSERRHLQGMYNMAMHLRAQDITPVFVFDGNERTGDKQIEYSKRNTAQARVVEEFEAEIQRTLRILVAERICARYLQEEDGRISGDLGVCTDAIGRNTGGSGFSFDPISEISLDQSSSEWNRQSEDKVRHSATQLSDRLSREDAVGMLEDLAARLQAKQRQLGKKPTISERLDRLELSTWELLLYQLGARDSIPPEQLLPADPTHSTLQSLRRFSDERLQALRRRAQPLTYAHIDECRQLVAALGFATYTTDGPTESEAVCAALTRAGVCDAVCSEDLDVLAFGGPRLLRGFGVPRQQQAGQMMLIDLAAALDELRLSQAAFVDLCILCGTDFASTLEGVGPVTALELMRSFGSIENILATGKYRTRDFFCYEQARAIFGMPVELPFASRAEVRPMAESPADVLDALLPLRAGSGKGGATQDGCDPFGQPIL